VARTFDVCEDAMKAAGLRPTQLDNVILVGGSTRIPMLQRMVAEYFGRQPLVNIDPDLVVAQGAALHAQSLTVPARKAPFAKVALKKVAQPSAGADIENLEDEVTNVGNRPPLPPLPPPPVARAARKATLPGQAPPPPLRMDRGGDDLLDMPTVNREPPTVTGEPGFHEQPTHAGPVAEGEDTRFTQQPTQAGPLDFATSPAEDASRLLMQIGEEFVDPSAAPESIDPEPSSLLVELGEDFAGRDSVPMGDISDTDLELDVGSQAPETLRAALDEQVDTVTGAVAAIQPAATRPKAPLLLDVTPLSLGVETVDGYCERIIRRNSAIPAGQTKMFTTARDHQNTVIVRICQGENRRVSGNQLLGEVVLDGLRPAARGKVQIAVRFMIDADGTLQVRAQDVGTGQQQQIAIKLIGEIPDAQIEQLRERHEAKLGS